MRACIPSVYRLENSIGETSSAVTGVLVLRGRPSAPSFTMRNLNHKVKTELEEGKDDDEHIEDVKRLLDAYAEYCQLRQALTRA